MNSIPKCVLILKFSTTLTHADEKLSHHQIELNNNNMHKIQSMKPNQKNEK